MGRLNKNNFLRWTGNFTKRIASGEYGNTFCTLFANQDYVYCTPLSICSASLGIDNTSFNVTLVSNGFGTDNVDLSLPLFWDSSTGTLTIYRPIDLTITDLFITFTFKDVMGNAIADSIGGYQIRCTISPIITSWVQYPASATCALDNFGNNNGLLQWSQLKLINTGTGSDITPLQLKPNIISDPDYFAPVTDVVTCPVGSGSTYASLIVANFSAKPLNPGDWITMTQITLSCSACGAGGSSLLLVIPCNIAPGQTQRFNVPANPSVWDSGISISYNINGTMVGVTTPVQWKQQNNGVVDDFPSGGPHFVDDTGIYFVSPFVVPYPNGLTIFAT